MNTYIHYLDNNLIRDFPTDVHYAHAIYGPDLGSIKGKKVRKQPKSVLTQTILPLLTRIQDNYSNITICADIFFLNGSPFMYTISWNIQLRTVEELQSLSYKHLLQCMRSVIELYNARGFQVDHPRADNEFEFLTKSIQLVLTHITAKNKHTPEVEQSIQTIKERVQANINTFHFNYFPKLMLSHLVLHNVKLLNMFPAANGVNNTISPHIIMTRLPCPSFQTFSLRFGSYVQTHEIDNIINNITPRTTRAITLTPSNDHGG